MMMKVTFDAIVGCCCMCTCVNSHWAWMDWVQGASHGVAHMNVEGKERIGNEKKQTKKHTNTHTHTHNVQQ